MNKSIPSSQFGPLLLLLVSMSNISLALAAVEAQPQQLQKIISLQNRANALTYDNHDLNSYHLAKARIWLDMAQSEYYEKDTGGIISAAIGQATTLLDALETRQNVISLDTPFEMPGSQAIRPDLRDKISTLKKHENFSCGQRPIAEAEVYLVWAGHEFSESGMSHAEADIRAVENLVYDGEVVINNCAASTPKQVQVHAPAPLPVPVMESIAISTDGLFAFNQATLNPAALARLNELATSMMEMGSELEQVTLIGHTDRLRSDGRQERNKVLSEQRAESIKEYLVSKGIPTDKILASGMGSAQPVVQCPTTVSKEKQITCLQPNRRVEIVLRGKKAVGGNQSVK